MSVTGVADLAGLGILANVLSVLLVVLGVVQLGLVKFSGRQLDVVAAVDDVLLVLHCELDHRVIGFLAGLGALVKFGFLAILASRLALLSGIDDGGQALALLLLALQVGPLRPLDIPLLIGGLEACKFLWPSAVPPPWY